MVNLVLCTDETYAPYCAVVMVSTLAHTKKSEQLRFFILTPGLEKQTSKALCQLAAKQGAQAHIITPPPALASHIDLKRFGASSVMRLVMHKYLPQDCHKAIYLDCDLLVLDDITALWNTPLHGKAVGAVTDLCSPNTFSQRNPLIPYCNSGVLLIDLERWKQEKIGEQAIDYIKENAESLHYFDQDALNHVLQGNWHSLDLSWNFQSAGYSALERNYDYLKNRRAELKQAVKHPKIVHFIGGTKPWHQDCKHPLQNEFIVFSQYTPWPLDSTTLASKAAQPRSYSIRHLVSRLTQTLKTRQRRKKVDYHLPDLSRFNSDRARRDA